MPALENSQAQPPDTDLRTNTRSSMPKAADGPKDKKPTTKKPATRKPKAKKSVPKKPKQAHPIEVKPHSAKLETKSNLPKGYKHPVAQPKKAVVLPPSAFGKARDKEMADAQPEALAKSHKNKQPSEPKANKRKRR